MAAVKVQPKPPPSQPSIKAKVGEAKANYKRHDAQTQRVYEKLQARKHAESIPNVHALAAEWMIGLSLAVIALFFKKGEKDSVADDMSRFSYRVMGLCIVFFLLSLGVSSSKLSKACIAFGGLIDLMLLLNLISTTPSDNPAGGSVPV